MIKYKLGIYDLCGNEVFFKEATDGFCTVSKNEAPAYCWTRWQPYIDDLLKHGVTLDQFFIAARL